MIEVLNDYRPINACDEMMDEALHVKIKNEMKALASNFIIYDRPTY